MRLFEREKDSHGFTLLELAVVLAVIAILAAILTPLVTGYVERAREDAAKVDLKSIATAVVRFNTDEKFWPIYKVAFGSSGHTSTNSSTDVYDVIQSGGLDATIPSSGGGSDWSTTIIANSNTFESVMNKDFYTNISDHATRFKGPYLQFGVDPWGTRYYLTANNLMPSSANHAYVISAGPNQTIETNYTNARSSGDLAAGGDDLIQVIR
jgi:prepilin-type N-terminal cleavage/methylation domain-containing protein